MTKSSINKYSLNKNDNVIHIHANDKELLDLFTKHVHHQNITLLYLCQDMFSPVKYESIRVFPGTPTTWLTMELVVVW